MDRGLDNNDDNDDDNDKDEDNEDKDENKDKDKDEDENKDDNESEDQVDASLAEDEYRLEPPRPPVETIINLDQMEDLPQESLVFRLRGGYEQPLKNNPFVVKFPGIAGFSHTVNNNADMGAATAADTHESHAVPAPGTNNPFAPFSSRMEWEIARWAKLRGPGSTAFSELMSIEGVG